MPEVAGGEALEELVGQPVKLLALVLTAKVGTKTPAPNRVALGTAL
jgi:hypothetical protein